MLCEVGGWGYAVSCVLVVGWGRGGGAEAHEACARACEVGVERLWRGLLVRVWRGAHPSRTIQLGRFRTEWRKHFCGRSSCMSRSCNSILAHVGKTQTVARAAARAQRIAQHRAALDERTSRTPAATRQHPGGRDGADQKTYKLKGRRDLIRHSTRR